MMIGITGISELRMIVFVPSRLVPRTAKGIGGVYQIGRILSKDLTDSVKCIQRRRVSRPIFYDSVV